MSFDIKFDGMDVQIHPTCKRGRVVIFSHVTLPEAEEMAQQIVNVYPGINVGKGYEEGLDQGLSDGWDNGYEEYQRRLGAWGGKELVAEFKYAGVDVDVVMKTLKASYPDEFKKIAEEK